jgi:predicted nucleotidyltransferase
MVDNKNTFEARKLAGLIEQVDLRDGSGYDSERLFTEVQNIQPELINKLERGLQWIKDNNIHCVVVGGTAVVQYVSGARDLTPDIDFLVADFANLVNASKRDELTTSPIALMVDPAEGITIEEFDMDFMDAKTGNVKFHQYIIQTARQARIGGATLNIISPEVLAIMKFNLGRDKDDSDAFLLLQSGKMTQEAYLKAISDLSGSLRDEESLKLYAQMIK